MLDGDYVTARRAHRGREPRAVAVGQLPEGQLSASGDQLVTRRQHRHPGAPINGHRAGARRGGGHDPGRAQSPPGSEDNRARWHFFASPPDRLPEDGRDVDTDRRTTPVRVLDGDDGVDVRRDEAARQDPYAGPGR